MNDLYPFVMQPAYKDYMWGGRRIIDTYQRNAADGTYAESWEVSDRPEGESTISNGPLASQPLSALIREFGTALLGTQNPADRFPLLVKLIDAQQPLSVQVHPSDSTAPLTGGEAKTEMWYVLAADPDAAVYAGLQPDVTPEMFRAAIENHTLGRHLRRIPVKAGDVIFIPGGLVHAIDKGCLLLEAQQNSNTTYRIYDWGRVGTDGKPRELHIDQALQCIDWQAHQDPRKMPTLLNDDNGCRAEQLLRCEYFRVNRCTLSAPVAIDPHPETFRIFFVEKGTLKIQCDDQELTLSPGQTVFMPAALPGYTLSPADATLARVLSIF
jgi:mannose-6-phosphate isomerase